MIPYLDKDFLRNLDQYHHKTIYAKIIALNYQEQPIEQIEGVVTGGSISVDGTSAIRRSCNLTMVAKNVTINNVYWGLSNKVSIEIGLENQINSKYAPIIWFKQGIFVLTEFKTSHQVNNYTITLSGKDKMCLLNGDLGGTFNAETDLGIQYNKNDLDEITEQKIPIAKIITEMIHQYAHELFSNIVIKDMDSFGLQLLENKSSDLIYYLLYDIIENNDNGAKKLKAIITNNSIDWISCSSCSNIKKVSDIESYLDEISFYQTIEEDDISLLGGITDFSIFTYQQKKYYIQRIGRGDTIGYKPIELIYPDELIASVGDSITSVLDKIVKTFGDFEYFYNLDGQFVFQKKQTYINTSWNNIVTINNETYINPALLANKTSYSFDNASLITTFANNPQLNHIKNDYTVWGKKRTSDGGELPIHARYAIDKKPEVYCAFNKQDINKPGPVYCTSDFYQNNVLANIEAAYTQSLTTKKRPPEFLINATYYDYKKLQAAGVSTPTNDMIIHYTEEELNEMWWTVLDWGHCYESLMNERPSKRLMDYGTIPCCATIHFPGEDNARFLRSQLIFDVDRNSGTPHTGQVNINGHTQNTWYPFQHGFQGCGHSFEFFMDLDDNNTIDSWVFCPDIPKSDKEKALDKGAGVFIVDWREIIYQMAKDYFKFYHSNSFQYILMKNNVFDNNQTLYPTGSTGYEQYYHDLEGFWRQLYLGYDTIPENLSLEDYYTDENSPYVLWNKNVLKAPSELLFWFDFFDNKQSQIEAFSIPAIGDRAKNISDDNIRAIIYTDTPDVVYPSPGDNDKIETFRAGYQIYTDADNDIIGNMSISARGKSIHDEIDNMLYQYSFFNNSITITCLPIYYLEPNTIISVNDELSNIHGYFTLNKFTIPLDYKGTMSITAVEIPQRIY